MHRKFRNDWSQFPAQLSVRSLKSALEMKLLDAVRGPSSFRVHHSRCSISKQEVLSPTNVHGGERVSSGVEIKEIETFASFIINSFSFIMRVIVNFLFSVVGF